MYLMHCVDRRARLAWGVGAFVCFFVMSCAGKPAAQIMPDLVAHKPVCLALDWGAGPPPNFFGWTAPDTMLLLPARGEQLGHADSTGAEGRVALAPSQQDREGGGWIWWTQHDTLRISSMSPTMDNLVVSATRPDRRADWRGSGMAVRQHGQVSLHRYPC
jgi:hypothetical protein